MKEINEQKEKTFLTKLYFNCFLAILWPNPRLIVNITCLQKLITCSKYSTFSRLHSCDCTEQNKAYLQWRHESDTHLFLF